MRSFLPLIMMSSLLTIMSPVSVIAEESGEPSGATATLGVDFVTVRNPYTEESGLVKKDAVLAIIQNVAMLNQYLLSESVEENEKQITVLSKAIQDLLPSLKRIGLFDFFTPNEWLMDANKQPARALTAILYLQKYPEKMTPETKKALTSVLHESHVFYLKNGAEKLLKEAGKNH